MTFEELQKLLGYDALSPMYQDLIGGGSNPFYAENPMGGPGQYLGVQGAQMYNQFDPSVFDPYTFDWQGSGPGNSGTVSAFKDGQQQGSWSQYDTPFSETAMDALMTAGVAFGGLGLAGAGPLAGFFGGGAGAMGGLDAVAAAEAGAGGLSAAGGAGAAGMGGLDAVAAFEAGTGGLSAGGAGAAGISSLPANLGNFSAMAPETLSSGLSSSAASIPSFTAGSTLSGGGALSSIGNYLSGPGGLNLAGNLLGGYMQSRASGKASDALLQAGRESNALLKGMYDQTRADYAPYREAGYSALGQIQNLLKDPSAITQQADYKFGLDQGRNNLENSASARGMTYSGAQAKALQQYGNDYANTKLDQSYNRLANIAGIGQTATNSTTTAGMNYGNQAGNTLQNMGSARASGYVGQGNAWSNAFGSILNNYQDWDVNGRKGP